MKPNTQPRRLEKGWNMRALPKLCVLAGLALHATGALAKSPQQLASEAPALNAAWQARAALVPVKGMPRLADPVDAALIRSIFDLEKLRGLDPIAGADTPHLLDVCGAASNIWKSYLFWTKDGSPPNSANNEVAFAPEISLAAAYVITCYGRTADAIRLFTASLSPDQINDARRQGAEQARAGIMQMVMGIGISINYPHYTPGQKQLLANALEDAAPRFSAWSTTEGRAVIEASLSSVTASATDPTVKASLERALTKAKAVK
jgi:hypothetical protein